ncbi:MAG: hypothetical protein M3044_05130 [Thermoproteota archaeon]|nr:hypothetical protein [Thermoproteota archaeon]
MRYKPIFLIVIVILIPILIFVAPNVYAAKHLSNAQRYSDGYANGGQQASTDFQNHKPFNLTCDPTSHYTTGGGHTGIYCSGWTNGYTATWHDLALANPHTTNPPTTNSTTTITSPTTISSPTTDSWVTPLIVFVIVVIIIAAIARKIKHRGGKYRERQYFPDSIKENILDKQRHKCGHCNRLLNVVDYDHKDNDRSNNKESNCVALCPNCHAIKTRRTR